MGEAFAVFPASPAGKGGGGLERRVRLGWGVVGGGSAGAGLRGPRCHHPPASGQRRRADPLLLARRCPPLERAAAAPGCGRDSKGRPLGEATGDGRRGDGPARARIRRQLLLFGFPRLRVGREQDKHDDRARSLRNSKPGRGGKRGGGRGGGRKNTRK